MTLSQSRTSFDRKRWQLSRVIFTACLPSLIHCSAVPRLVQKGLGKARIAAARKLGIRLWILLRDQIDYKEFCRRGQMRQKSGAARAGMPAYNNGSVLQ